MAFIQRKHFQLYTETTPGEGGKTSSYEVLESIVYSSSSGSEPGNEPGNERSEVTFVVLFDCLRVGDDTQQIFRAAFAAVRDECTNVNRPIAERLRRALTQADEAVKRIVRSGDRTSSGGASIFIAALSDVKSSRGESTLKLQVTFSGNISSYWWHVDRVYSTVPQRLTIGHTWGQQNLALGLVAERDKGNYPQWHTPTQYLGAGEPIRPDLTLSVPKGRTYSTTDGLTLRPDDRVILCTVAVGHQALLDQASAGKTDARHFAKALAQRPTDTKTDRTVLLIDCRRARARVDWTTGILGFARWFGRWWWRMLLLLVVLGALGWGWQNPATVSKIYQNAKGFVTAVRMNPRESLVNPISDMFTSSATNSTPDETPTVTDEEVASGPAITSTMIPVSPKVASATETATEASPMATNTTFELPTATPPTLEAVPQTIPTVTDTPEPVPTATPAPTATDTPVVVPTATPVPTATGTPVVVPSATKTETPAITPTVAPSLSTNTAATLKYPSPKPLTPSQGEEISFPADSKETIAFRWSSTHTLEENEVYHLQILKEENNGFVAGNNPIIDQTIAENFEVYVSQLQGKDWLLWQTRTVLKVDGSFVPTSEWSQAVRFKITEKQESLPASRQNDDCSGPAC